MEAITLQTRLAALFGLPGSASENELLSKARQMMKEAENVTVLSEREMRLREMEKAMNCSREVAVFALAEQEKYDKNPPPRL